MVIQVLSDEAVEGHKKLSAECAGVVKYRLTRENFMSPHTCMTRADLVN